MEQAFDRAYELEDQLHAVLKEVDIQEVRYRERVNVDNEPIVDVTVFVPMSTDLRNMPFNLLDKVIQTIKEYFSHNIPGKYTLVTFGKS